LLFVRYVSSDANNREQFWGNILLSIFGAGSLITVFLFWVAPHLLGRDSALLVLPLALADCICRQLTVSSSQVFQAFEKMRMTAFVNLLTSFFRLAAIVAVISLLHHTAARRWAPFYLLSSGIAALAGVGIVSMRFGAPGFSPRLFASKLGEGFGFAFAGSTQSAYNDIDKAMLSHFGMNVANGIYTFAYRIIDVATVPIMALDSAALPRFFRQSSTGYAGVRALSVRLAGRAMLFGVLIGAAVFCATPLIPRIAGDGFRESAIAMRWLCVIPAFRGLHQLTGSAITGLGYQRYRTAAQFVAAALNFCLNLWLIPCHGWTGAAWASIATDGALAVMNGSILASVPHLFPATPATGGTA
jgi:O-antigen/teichoic acid export membrane protein